MSIVENGELAERALEEIIKEHGEKILRASIKKIGDKFSLFIKLIDANKDLSVQAYTNYEYARIMEIV